MNKRFRTQRLPLYQLATTLLCKLTVLFALSLWSLQAAGADALISTPTTLDKADYTLWQSDGLPDQSARWQPVSLPFVSAYAGLLAPGQFPPNSTVWFRFLLESPEQPATLSLLFWRYNLSMTVYFNGEEIAANTRREGRTTAAWNRPLLAHVSNTQWRPGLNEVLVQLNITQMGGNLAPPLVGPRDQLEDIYASRMFRQVDVNRVLLAFAFTISFFTFALWLMRRQDDVYLWFSVMALAWGIATSHTVIYHNLLPMHVWLPIVHIAIDVCTFCMYGFVGRLAQARRPVREKVFMAWTVTAALINLTLSPQWFWQVTYAMHLVGITALGLIAIRVAAIALRKRQTEAVIITLAIFGQIVLFVINAFQMFFSTGVAWDSTLVFAHFGLPVLLMIFAAVLLRRFTDALHTAETLNRELEQKVEESRQIIERSFEQRRVLEMEQAAEKERLKIYRDLHDDVGSRLLSIVHADSGNKLGNMARAALESLRQAVSKANTPDQPLASLLRDIREETELRLTGSGHTVSWHQQDMPDVIVASDIAFNVNRIMKEVVSNIIRHAHASEVHVVIVRQHQALRVTVTDNGRGFLPGASDGNGLGNIRSRSAEIGATVTTDSSTLGTRISLSLPLWETGPGTYADSDKQPDPPAQNPQPQK